MATRGAVAPVEGKDKQFEKPPLHVVGKDDVYELPSYAELGAESTEIGIMDRAVDRSIPLPYINTLKQIRHSDNPKHANLTKSIRAKGLIHPLTVAELTAGSMQEYINFTNRTWNSEARLDELMPTPEGTYIVVIAGHSRLTSVKIVAEEREMPGVPVRTRVVPVESVDDIIGLQFDENIHSDTARDRSIRAFAEAFLWEQHSNPSLTQKEFAKKHHLSDDAISDALAYVSLPRAIRELADDDALPFGVAVELARAQRAIKEDWIRRINDKHYAHKSGRQILDVNDWQANDVIVWGDMVIQEMLRYIAMYNTKGNIAHTRQWIRTEARAKRDNLREAFGKAVEQEDLQMTLMDADDVVRDRWLLVQRELKKSLRDYKDRHDWSANRLHKATVAILDFGEVEVDDTTATEALHSAEQTQDLFVS